MCARAAGRVKAGKVTTNLERLWKLKQKLGLWPFGSGELQRGVKQGSAYPEEIARLAPVP